MIFERINICMYKWYFCMNGICIIDTCIWMSVSDVCMSDIKIIYV